MKKTIEQPKDNTNVEDKELFTQGDWHTELNNRGAYTCVYAYPNKFICDARGRQGSINGDEFENVANAALISQAPAMYRALIKWQSWFCGDLNELDGAALFEETKSILKKATP